MKSCQLVGCDRPAHSRGYCSTHFWRFTHEKDLEAPIPGPRIAALNGLKYCADCNTTKAVSDFYIDRHMPDGLHHRCKTCASELKLAQWLKDKYGLTVDEYKHMRTTQQNLCAICHRAETSRSNGSDAIKALAVDHDHKTGKIRALLCNDCNTALGHLHEDPIVIEALLRYVELHCL